MNDYFQLERDDQRRVLQQVAARYGLPPQTVEKDLWVTTILQVVFTLPIADKLIFKGGTTLSKVSAAVAGKTFLEKAFLLHEMFSIEGHGARAERRSRHLYDLSQMMDKGFALNAMQDDSLWESIRHHRSVFTSVSGMDYGQDIRRNIVLVPRLEIMSAWEADYSNMSSVMIYGNKPTFSELIERMRELETRFHSL